MADEDPPNTLEEIAGVILDIIAGCLEAFKAKTDEDYEGIAMSELSHWQPVVLHIQSFHPDLFPLNNLLSLLNYERDLFKKNYRELLIDLNNTCREYEPFAVLLQGDFGSSLDGFLEEMLSDVETDGEADDGMDD
jgi:hypothetical protein